MTKKHGKKHEQECETQPAEQNGMNTDSAAWKYGDRTNCSECGSIERYEAGAVRCRKTRIFGSKMQGIAGSISAQGG